MSTRRSASVGALPREKKHFVSRNESSSGISLDVRCACQYFQSDSLLPERINPVDSRPNSQLGYYADTAHETHVQDKDFKNVASAEQLSLQMFHPQLLHREADHLSVRSLDAGGRTQPAVDLSFVEKYPELEETAKKRGLVIRSISDATEADYMSGAGMHQSRKMSTGGMSAGFGARRDVETLSMRSVTSLRRLPSRTPSRGDLYMADINIPTTNVRSSSHPVSASVSRRTSNADLSYFVVPTQINQQPQPQFNIIAPTPSVAQANMPPQFSRSTTPQLTASDYRVAKLPLSTDYMRPDENKENFGYMPPNQGEILPQHKPIDMRKYGNRREYMETEEEQTSLPNTIAEFERISSRQNSPAPIPSTVREVIAKDEPIIAIQDEIILDTKQPPILKDEIPQDNIHLAQQTDINIVKSTSQVNLEEMEREVLEKAKEAGFKSMPKVGFPTTRNQTSPAKEMHSLELPDSQPKKSLLKRQHTPDRETSVAKTAATSNKEQLQVTSAQTASSEKKTIQGAISLQEASPEAKSTYASRFKAMFSSTPHAEVVQEAAIIRAKSKSPSPAPKTSPLPTRPSRIKTMFTKSTKTAPLEIMTSNNVSMQKTKPEAEVLCAQVTETFALKVDEMDQYHSRPKLHPPPPPAMPQMLPLTTSREDFNRMERQSADVSEAFAPIVIPAASRSSLLAGNRTIYASDIAMQRAPSRSESEFRASSREPGISRTSLPKGTLISMPIMIGSQQNLQQHAHMTATTFLEGRTQSQDRAQQRSSNEDFYTSRMSKTVSFHFDERKSRLSNYESSKERHDQYNVLERTQFSRDHEYELIGVATSEETPNVGKVDSAPTNNQNESLEEDETAMDAETEGIHQAEKIQKDFEERFFSSQAALPKSETHTDHEEQASHVESSIQEELPLKPENGKRSFMASAQDRTRRMQAGFKTQAGKIKTKLRSPMKKSATIATDEGSPEPKERKRFSAPQFSKIKMPEIKRPDMSKFKEFKRPKFNKPDMSKFKIPEKFSTLKLRRSKSMKENEQHSFDSEMESSVASPDSKPVTEEAHPHKKMFDFHFGTYPRAFRKKKKPLEPQSSLGTEEPSIIPSTETQPSMESSSSPKGDRGPGPVRSRWADKFSDVSYNDSEGSRYRRYGSELESFDRESSLERRMKDDLEDTGSEIAPDLGILSGADDNKQFAEFNEENRTIHEISYQRAGEFKRRPMVHQDSDLRSEDSKDVGWTDKEIQKNKLLRKAELEAEANYFKYPSEEFNRQETQSTASSRKKVVMEEIDDDEFFIRKRGISEDNIEFRQYISHAIRQGYDMPHNALEQVGHTSEPMEYDDYDLPPPKPRRLNKNYRPEETSQEFHSRSEFGDDLSISQNGSDFYPPKRPLRKGRSKYSMDSQDIPMTDDNLLSREQYFDDDEDYLRPPQGKLENQLNDLNKTTEESRPQAPLRRKHRDGSMEKDIHVNGFTGRSVSSSYLQPTEALLVYHTDNEYPVPLATPEDEQCSRVTDMGSDVVHDKYVIDMLENDGYAIVRKEQVPKPTPPARRKKFTRLPGERFTTLPNMRNKRSSTSPPERPPPPQDYKPTIIQESQPQPQPPRRKSVPPQK